MRACDYYISYGLSTGKSRDELLSGNDSKLVVFPNLSAFSGSNRNRLFIFTLWKPSWRELRNDGGSLIE